MHLHFCASACDTDHQRCMLLFAYLTVHLQLIGSCAVLYQICNPNR